MKKLPSPRLEIVWKRNPSKKDNHRFQWVAYYNLVLPVDKYDVRNTTQGKPGEIKIRIGKTKRGASNSWEPLFGDQVDTPFRDYHHMIWDSSSLGGIPCFACYKDKATKIVDELSKGGGK